MKSLFLAATVALLATLVNASPAQAGILEDGGCSMMASSESPEMDITYASAFGMSCEQLIRLDANAQLLNIALEPLGNLTKIPAVQAAIAGAAAKVTSALMAHPMVLAVTVIGAAGIYTSYVVVRLSIEDCKKMEPSRLRDAIDSDLQQKYGLKPVKSIPLEIRN